jgi:hypothetical protein
MAYYWASKHILIIFINSRATAQIPCLLVAATLWQNYFLLFGFIYTLVKTPKQLGKAMITKEKVREEIDRLSEAELEKVYSYLSSLRETKKSRPNIRSLRLNGELDKENLRSIAFE